ncbi:hypothetical protein V2G26_017815 [Clonostachys chloroleuca]
MRANLDIRGSGSRGANGEAQNRASTSRFLESGPWMAGWDQGSSRPTRLRVQEAPGSDLNVDPEAEQARTTHLHLAVDFAMASQRDLSRFLGLDCSRSQLGRPPARRLQH